MKKNKFNVKWSWVRDKSNEIWRVRIFIADLGEQINTRYKTVALSCEDLFFQGEKILLEGWQQMKPFTAEDYFRHCFPEWLAEKAIANIDKSFYYYEKHPKNCIEALRCFFDWDKSPDCDFWDEVLYHILNPESNSLPKEPKPRCQCIDISRLDMTANYCFLCGRKLK